LIPWLKLIRHAPKILSLARELRQRTRRTVPPVAAGATDEVQALAADLQRHAEVLHALAAQVEGLTAAAVSLRRALFLALFLGAAAFLLAAAALVLAMGA
jgi:MoxR-like ATPase